MTQGQNTLNISFVDLQDQPQIEVAADVDSKPMTTVLSEGLLVGPIHVSGILNLVDAEVFFNGNARGKWQFDCTRCLKSVNQDWNVVLEHQTPYSDGAMDLNDELRQSIGLAQPMRILCKPDCQGLCQVCGKNKNTSKCAHGERSPQEIGTRSPRLTIGKKKG